MADEVKAATSQIVQQHYVSIERNMDGWVSVKVHSPNIEWAKKAFADLDATFRERATKLKKASWTPKTPAEIGKIKAIRAAMKKKTDRVIEAMGTDNVDLSEVESILEE